MRCRATPSTPSAGSIAHEFGHVPRRGEAVVLAGSIRRLLHTRRRGALVQGARRRCRTKPPPGDEAQLDARHALSTAPACRAPARLPLGADLALGAGRRRAAHLAFVVTAAWPLQLALVALLAWRCARGRPRRAAALGLGLRHRLAGPARSGGCSSPCTATAAWRRRWPRWPCSAWRGALALSTPARWRFTRTARRDGRAPAPCCFAACGCSPSWLRGVLVHRLSLGAPAATRTSTGRSPRSRPGRASTAWASSPPSSARCSCRGCAPWRGRRGARAAARGAGAAAAAGRAHAARAASAAGRPLVRHACCRATSRRTRSSQLAPACRRRWPGTGRAAARRATARWSSRPRPPSRCCREQLPDGYWEPLVQRASQRARRRRWSACRWAATSDGYTNSVVGLGRGDRGAAPARHLPLRQAPPGAVRRIHPDRLSAGSPSMMNIPLGDFNRGAARASRRSPWQGQRLAPNICYEDLFGEELAARFADAAHGADHLRQRQQHRLVRQHASPSTSTCRSRRMRALEFERPMLRATNTGATAIIDHRGPRHAPSCRRYTPGVLDGDGAGPRRH